MSMSCMWHDNDVILVTSYEKKFMRKDNIKLIFLKDISKRIAFKNPRVSHVSISVKNDGLK